MVGSIRTNKPSLPLVLFPRAALLRAYASRCGKSNVHNPALLAAFLPSFRPTCALVVAPLHRRLDAPEELRVGVEVRVRVLVLLHIPPALGNLDGVAREVHLVREPRLLAREEVRLPIGRERLQELRLHLIQSPRDEAVASELELNVLVRKRREEGALLRRRLDLLLERLAQLRDLLRRRAAHVLHNPVALACRVRAQLGLQA
mmetsp:Transcript_710/g.1755  ORF Transcript_710/g.1755 Transcript_710/m.1755 type:complete len:203 (-) Transcript_710:331-939(-)